MPIGNAGDLIKIRTENISGAIHEFATAENYTWSLPQFGPSAQILTLHTMKFAVNWVPSMLGQPSATGIQWNNPTQVQGMANTPTLDDARLILAAACKMMGGSISFSREELRAANAESLMIAQSTDRLIASVSL